jgi:hypothetical protein
MRKLLTLIIGFTVAAGLVMAQSHENTTEKVAKDTITFATDVRIGTQVLPAGEYKVVCDKHQVMFTPKKDGQPFQFECKGAQLPEARKSTEMHTSVAPDGVRTLDKLFLKGSNVEHVFK